MILYNQAITEKWSRARVQVSGSFQDISPTNVNCSTSTDTVVNGMITKFGSLCDLTFVYTWTGAGAQDNLGQAYDYKEFSLALIDLSGNISVDSSRVVVYNDRSGSVAPTVNIYSTNLSKTIVENVTGATQVKVDEIGEMKADAEFKIISPKNVVSTRVQRQGQLTDASGVVSSLFAKDCRTVPCATTTVTDNYSSEAIINLGAQSADVNTTILNGRKVGIDSDGIYTIQVRNIDTAGNYGAVNEVKLERDTVSPPSPIVTGTADEANYKYSIKVVGEPNTFGEITGSTYAKFNLDASGVGYINAIDAKTYTYATTFSWNVKNIDKAGNKSVAKALSFTTKALPVVTSGVCISNVTAKLSSPFSGKYVKTSTFGNRVNPITGVSELHDGVDYGLPMGTEVLAAEGGIVENVYYEKEGGLVIVISHANGIKTMYAHLSNALVRKGQVVVRGNVLAKSGNSGAWTTGAHLHFSVSVNNVKVDPTTVLFDCTPVVSTTTTIVEEDYSISTKILCNAPLVVDYYAVYGTTDLIINDPLYCKTATGNTITVEKELVASDIADELDFGLWGVDQTIIDQLNGLGYDVKTEIAKCALNETETSMTNEQSRSWIQTTLGYVEMGLGFVPYAGDGIDGLTATLGTNPITLEEAGCIDRTIRGIFSSIGVVMTLASTGSGAGVGAGTGCAAGSVAGGVGCVPVGLAGTLIGAVSGAITSNTLAEGAERTVLGYLKSKVKNISKGIVSDAVKQSILKRVGRVVGEKIIMVEGEVVAKESVGVFLNSTTKKLTARITVKELVSKIRYGSVFDAIQSPRYKAMTDQLRSKLGQKAINSVDDFAGERNFGILELFDESGNLIAKKNIVSNNNVLTDAVDKNSFIRQYEWKESPWKALIPEELKLDYRVNDTEHKAALFVRDYLNANPTKNVSIKLFTERTMCKDCINVINEGFMNDLGKRIINLNIFQAF